MLMPMDDDKAYPATEVLERLEAQQRQLEIVRWAAAAGVPAAERKGRVARLQREHGNGVFAELVFALTGVRPAAGQAHAMWDSIAEHREAMTRLLGRDPGVRVAALDWLGHRDPETVDGLSVVESTALRGVLQRAVADGLTGLYDHETFLSLLEKELERSRRHGSPVALLLLDLDDFKRINDRYGHPKGDEVLVETATVIRNTVRLMDIAGRYGGEEFAVALPDSDVAAARRSAQRLCRAMAGRFSDGLGVTISIGVACFPLHGDGVAALVEAADRALYSAKTNGKGRAVVAP